MILVANAPCSWGVLELETAPAQTSASQMLDEMAAAGYAGTELGDWGFLPTSPEALRAELSRRGLALVGAFVPVALSRADAIDEGIARAVRTARLLAAVTTSTKSKTPTVPRIRCSSCPTTTRPCRIGRCVLVAFATKTV